MISTKQFLSGAGKAVILIVSGFTIISFAIVLYQLKIGPGAVWMPDLANHVLIEIGIFTTLAGTLVFWGFKILYHMTTEIDRPSRARIHNPLKLKD